MNVLFDNRKDCSLLLSYKFLLFKELMILVLMHILLSARNSYVEGD